MKMRRPHWVPLAPQCVEILKQQHQISGDGRYVFPNGSSGFARPLSDGAMGAALKWLCFAHDGVVPHGFRVSASTLLPEGRVMMERWCAYIDELKAASNPGNAD
jgi:integrase